MAEPKIGWKAYNAQRAEYLRAYHAARYKRLSEKKIAVARKWYAENKEVALERQNAYREANPMTPEQKERKRLKAVERRRADPTGYMDAAHIQRARRRQCGARPSREKLAHLLANAVCAACGSTEKPEIDHIMPLSLGGNHEETNLQILCRPCNRSKGSKHPDEWKGRRIGKSDAR